MRQSGREKKSGKKSKKKKREEGGARSEKRRRGEHQGPVTQLHSQPWGKKERYTE